MTNKKSGVSKSSEQKSSEPKLVQQNPLIMRCHRLMEVFAKSDDERDFYLDRQEGFLIYFDLDKSQEELSELEKELKLHSDRYLVVPKLTFYEIKKIMEGFVNEKVYDIDTKEKLLDIIQSKEARENFLEFIYDHHAELEKWQQYYQEKFRVRIIEWLRQNQLDFVFEEDLEMTKSIVEKLKMNTFLAKVGKDILQARKLLVAKAKTYYSNEALNPRPKRGRPPKQVVKVETDPQFSLDIYTTVPKVVKPFLFTPEYQGSASIFTFSGKFASEADLIAHKRQQLQGIQTFDAHNIDQKLATLRSLSSQWMMTNKDEYRDESSKVGASTFGDDVQSKQGPAKKSKKKDEDFEDFDFDDEEDEDEAPRPRSSKKDKQAEETFFKSRKDKQAMRSDDVQSSSKKAKPSKALPKQEVRSEKSSKKEKAVKPSASVSSGKKNTQKARLRPLVKKTGEKKPAKEAPLSKKKTQPLRLLRRAKKK